MLQYKKYIFIALLIIASLIIAFIAFIAFITSI